MKSCYSPGAKRKGHNGKKENIMKIKKYQITNHGRMTTSYLV